MQLPEWFRDVDVHTHVAPADGRAIVSVNPGQGLGSAPHYSVGIHPWHADTGDVAEVEHLAADPRVVAIGECGIDKLRGPGLEVQMPVFEAQARLAERLQKPLIIHCVRAYGEIMALHDRLHPTVPWIIHGFNRNAALARQLTDRGIYLSIATNRPAPVGIDPAFILRETDTTL